MESIVCIEMNESDSENVPTVEEVEWMKLKNARLKEGYVDGKYAGSETAKESGEEHGYVKGFEDSFNYTLSMAMGLLGVNQCILRNIESPLLSRAKEIKISLDSFRKKYNAMRMKEVECSSEKCQQESNDDPTVELLHDENSNLSSVSTENGRDLEPCRCKRNTNREYVTHEDLCQLKLEVLDFLNACHQPLILEQMTRIFEDLDQLLIESNASNQNHPDLSVSKVLCEST
ncbi:hypothetical protein AVEN_153747-1 [Araneus ventricosus]|uniref:Essential protein Yae1 N-terminal domain-containing protein n=1 Tax=Araneus ventricosus TaxID=182803 RepID=A0A4Y2LFM8_ARAVE|nr:hypothetical protein AVEN_153747-1 [Araneus ventricosus]